VDYDTILYEVADRTATITLNRPDQLNALSPHMVGELRRATRRCGRSS
jgi:enoyl-CoA hydratase/carnithine racemase